MPYKISHLSLHNHGPFIYFFDANIWLLILGLIPQPDSKQQKYIHFFECVLKSDAIILLPAILVSEVVNRMIYFQMNRYAKKKGDKVDPSYFKKVYREQPEFKLALQKIYDDFHIYARSCTLINDNFGQQGFGFTDLFTVNAPIIEFNDNYLYKLAKHHSAIVITDDGDFFVEDIPVYTLNNTLVNKAKALAVVGTDK